MKHKHNHHHCHVVDRVPGIHTNAFVDLNGIPYLLAEYLDKREFQQLEREYVKSEIFIDESEAMRAIIDINIDDIGRRASDGLPSICGNNTKQMRLLDMIRNNGERMHNQLPVLRRGILLKVFYQVENYTTRQTIRTMVETFRILNRDYFLDINPRNVDDNAIIAHFADSIVSTINAFTHGRDRMVLRVTHMQMFYECVRPDIKMPRIKQTPYWRAQEMPTCYGSEYDCYKYHEECQSQQFIGTPPMYDDCYGHEDVTPPMWSMFNRFYRFDHNGRDIILHGQEINDTMVKVQEIPCGTVRINRSFMINPGHRLIFKFNIWKNDVTVVGNTTRIAQELRAPYIDYCHDNCSDFHYDDYRCDNHDPINPDYETLLRMLHANKHVNDIQSCAINQLTQAVCSLQDIVKSMAGYRPDDPDDPMVNPEDPPKEDEGDNPSEDNKDPEEDEGDEPPTTGDEGLNEGGDLSVEHPEGSGEGLEVTE